MDERCCDGSCEITTYIDSRIAYSLVEQAKSVLVVSPRLLEPEYQSVRQMRLAKWDVPTKLQPAQAPARAC